MEYIDGIDVGALLKVHGKLLPDLAVSIAVQVAEALAYVHSKNVFRNDVSTRNIMLSRNGRVELIDFGIAIFALSQGTAAKNLGGTPPYMAPERFRSTSLDPRSDVYSLGIVLYEMLTGRRPFQASHVEALQWAHESEQPRELADFSAIPCELNDAVMKALQKDPGLRFASMSEFREALMGVPGDLVPTGISSLVSEALRARRDEEVKTALSVSIDLKPREAKPNLQDGPGDFTRLFLAPKALPIVPKPPPAPAITDLFSPGPATRYPAAPSPRVHRAEARLSIVGGPFPGKAFAVATRMSIGRSADNDVVLDDPKVSRFHAEIFKREGQYFISDLNTANGTKVGGKTIRQLEPLDNGNRIGIGDNVFEFAL
jgi:serine/threonine protein kinase